MHICGVWLTAVDLLLLLGVMVPRLAPSAILPSPLLVVVLQEADIGAHGGRDYILATFEGRHIGGCPLPPACLYGHYITIWRCRLSRRAYGSSLLGRFFLWLPMQVLLLQHPSAPVQQPSNRLVSWTPAAPQRCFFGPYIAVAPWYAAGGCSCSMDCLPASLRVLLVHPISWLHGM